MKPYTTAMKLLIQQVETTLPFGLSEAEICAGKCVGSPKKLLEYMSSELDFWQCELANGQISKLGDVSRLANISKKFINRINVMNWCDKTE